MTIVRRAARGVPEQLSCVQLSCCAAQPETLLPELSMPLEVGDELGGRIEALSNDELGVVFGRLCPVAMAMDLEEQAEEREEEAVAKVAEGMEMTEAVPECDTEAESEEEGTLAAPFEGRFSLRLEYM